MKVTAVILFFVALQVKASFFDKFRGAMSSVENAFGKLMNDVVTDVKSTVHCTILAMERVLAMNGVVPEPSFNNECYDYNSDVEDENANRNLHSADDIASQIKSSISRVNKTLSNILDNDEHKRLQDVKRIHKNESNRLTEVGYLLRQELEKISHRVRNGFQSKNFNSDKTSIESLWNDMKLLYKVEKNDKNVSEVREIGQVFNEALNLLHINTTGVKKTDEDKIKAIMLEIEHESNDKNVSTINAINRELSQWKDKQSALQIEALRHKQIPEVTPDSFRDVATDISNPNQKTRKEVNVYITNTSRIINNEYLNDNAQITSKSLKHVAATIIKDSKKIKKRVNDYITNISNRVVNNEGLYEKPQITSKSYKDEASKVIKDSEKLKNEVNKYITDTSNRVVHNEDLNELSQITSKSFKDVATEIIKDNEKIRQVDGYINDQSRIVNNKLLNEKSQVTSKSFKDVATKIIKDNEKMRQVDGYINDKSRIVNNKLLNKNSQITSKSFKDVATKIMNDNKKIRQVDGYINDQSRIVNNKLLNEKSQVTSKSFKDVATKIIKDNEKMTQVDGYINDKNRIVNNKLLSENSQITSKSMKNFASKMINDDAKINKEVNKYETNTSNRVVNNKDLNEKSKITSKSLKDVATNTIKDTEKISEEVNYLNRNTQSATAGTKSRNANPNGYSLFGDTNSEDNVKAIDVAMNILNEGIQSKKLLDDFFAKNEPGAENFDNSDLLDFK